MTAEPVSNLYELPVPPRSFKPEPHAGWWRLPAGLTEDELAMGYEPLRAASSHDSAEAPKVPRIGEVSSTVALGLLCALAIARVWLPVLGLL